MREPTHELLSAINVCGGGQAVSFNSAETRPDIAEYSGVVIWLSIERMMA